MAGSFLSCRVCLLRTIQLAAGRGIAEAPTLRAAAAHRSQRSSSSSSSSRSRSYTAAALPAVSAPVDAPRTLQAPHGEESEAVAEKKQHEKLQRAVNKHLSYMQDPWKIARHVDQTLAKDRFDEALLLTQRASKDRQVVVAWNHLIDYQLEKQHLKKAITLFNEVGTLASSPPTAPHTHLCSDILTDVVKQMKKRGQLPNVQTFTVIFRGCARSQHPKAAVAEAVKHYNVLMADKRIQPNSIHLNAVLNVCARAGDLDSMFLIADTVNDSTRAPTAYTYTTLLNALRHSVLKDTKDLPDEQRTTNLQRVVDRANGLWIEVMDKWKQGRLVIDEELVCSMGRVLLLSPKREDKRLVLELLQQTMNVPNLANAPGSDPFQDADMQNVSVTNTPRAVAASKAVYAVPSRNTLALLLTTLASSKLTTVGIKYWNLMVRHYGIVPDNDNWLRMFGMLKVAKASAHAASILEILPAEFVHTKPYRIAMETCVRDNINPNAVGNSTAILNSMMSRLDVPDIHTLRLYLRVALVSHHHLRTRARSGDRQGAKRDYGVQIASALANLWEPYKKVHYRYFKATPPPADKKDDGVLYNNKREVIALARLMFSAFNKVLNESMLPEADLRELRPVGAKINREIQAFYSNREQAEPKLRPSSSSEPDVEPDVENEVPVAVEDAAHRQGGAFVWDTTKPADPASFRKQRT
ncbi:pentatricopeptide repeat protein [Metarhizium album ARSEF 1941]|uniref:Pentatricopeptide repeat protein n=1 Tax=Metarhizium album (strain ARSEF 1941) TaxID=1081103 RepID=A0A0B2X6C7_METAS|nr:pentatricopeptide repeat protein [Metarhizium album ARSEF 1941]KHO00836.1 pentatricopeptide repeat protein [Metarhizium album ARSEF 1941]